eukprot:m51a1_g7027 putative calpain-type cysteine protease dek1 (1677) ;mRNA; f:58924-65797
MRKAERRRVEARVFLRTSPWQLRVPPSLRRSPCSSLRVPRVLSSSPRVPRVPSNSLRVPRQPEASERPEPTATQGTEGPQAQQPQAAPPEQQQLQQGQQGQQGQQQAGALGAAGDVATTAATSTGEEGTGASAATPVITVDPSGHSVSGRLAKPIAFDEILDDSATNEELYGTFVQPAVAAAEEGRCALVVFAGAGLGAATDRTVFGQPDGERGILSNVLAKLAAKYKGKTRVSCVQVCGQRLVDLLTEAPGGTQATGGSPRGGPQAAGGAGASQRAPSASVRAASASVRAASASVRAPSASVRMATAGMSRRSNRNALLAPKEPKLHETDNGNFMVDWLSEIPLTDETSTNVVAEMISRRRSQLLAGQTDGHVLLTVYVEAPKTAPPKTLCTFSVAVVADPLSFLPEGSVVPAGDRAYQSLCGLVVSLASNAERHPFGASELNKLLQGPLHAAKDLHVAVLQQAAMCPSRESATVEMLHVVEGFREALRARITSASQKNKKAGPERVSQPTAPQTLHREVSPKVQDGSAIFEQEKEALVARYSALLDECRKAGGKYEDKEFPVGPWCLWFDGRSPSSTIAHPTTWRRASELAAGPSMFGFEELANPVTLASVEQGALGSMHFISSALALSARPDLLKALFVASDLDSGIFAIMISINLCWRGVVIDDFVPCTLAGRPLFTCIRDKSTLWLCLLEKAYAKLHGCYENIDGGVERHAISDLIGSCPLVIDLRDPHVQVDWRSGRLWQIVSNRVRDGAVVTCGGGDRQDDFAAIKGVVPGLSYLVVRMAEVEGHRLALLFTPQPNCAWTGRWGEGDSVWRDRPEFVFKLGGHVTTDGMFWMDWNDVCQIFPSVNIFRMPNRAKSCTTWGFWDYGLNQKDDMCGGPDNWIHNPQYGLAIKESTAVQITVCQPSTKVYDGEDFYPVAIGIRVYLTTRTNQWNILDPTQSIIIASSSMVRERSVSLEVNLDPQDDPYTIVLLTEQPGVIMPYCVRVSSQKEITVLDPMKSGAFSKRLEGAPPAAPYADIFEEWYFDGRPILMSMQSASRLQQQQQQQAHAEPQHPRYVRVLGTKDLRVSRYRPVSTGEGRVRARAPRVIRPMSEGGTPSRYSAVWREIVAVRRLGNVSTVQLHWGDAMEKLVGKTARLIEPHPNCENRSCIDWSNSWKRICVLLVGTDDDQQLLSGAKDEQSAERVLIPLKGEEVLLEKPGMEALVALLVARGLVKDASHIRQFEAYDESEWRLVRTFQDIVECAVYPDLHLRLSLVVPTFSCQPSLVQLTGGTAVLSWKVPQDPLPIVSYTLSAREFTIDQSEEIGCARVFDLKAPSASMTEMRVSVAELKSTRSYSFTVAAANEVGKGPRSPPLWITAADLLNKMLMTNFGSHRRAVLCSDVLLWQEKELLLTGSRDMTARAWELPAGTLLQTFSGHKGALYCVCVGRGPLFFTGSEDRTIRCWDISSGKCLRELCAHKAAVRALCWREDVLYSSSSDSTIRAWDVDKGTCVSVLPCDSCVFCFHSAPAGIFAGLENGMIDMFGDGALRKSLAVHPGSVSAVSGDDTGVVFSCCYGGFVNRWSKRGECVWSKRVHRGPVYALCLLAGESQRRLFTASFDGTVAVLDSVSGHLVFRFPLGHGPVGSIVQRPGDPQSLYIGMEDGAVAELRVPTDLSTGLDPTTLSVSLVS